MDKQKIKSIFIKDLNKNEFSKKRLVEMYTQSFGYRYKSFFENLAKNLTSK